MPAPDVGDSSEEASPAPDVDGLVRHYTRADVTLTPGIERMDALASQIKAQKSGASKLRAETIAALRATYLASDWHRALSAYLEECSRTSTEEELDALEVRLGNVTRAISATPVRTPDDLIVRAAMAVCWNQGRLSDPPYPDCVLNSKKACSDDRALATVVRGVLDLAGLKFDAEGRLVDE